MKRDLMRSTGRVNTCLSGAGNALYRFYSGIENVSALTLDMHQNTGSIVGNYGGRTFQVAEESELAACLAHARDTGRRADGQHAAADGGDCLQ